MAWPSGRRELKVFTYKPKLEKEDGELIFKGDIELKIPRYKDRIKLIKECNFQVGKDGAMESGSSQYDSVLVLLDVVEKHVESVKIVHIDSETVIDSLEDLEYFQEGSELVNELGNVILGGIGLGKK